MHWLLQRLESAISTQAQQAHSRIPPIRASAAPSQAPAPPPHPCSADPLSPPTCCSSLHTSFSVLRAVTAAACRGGSWSRPCSSSCWSSCRLQVKRHTISTTSCCRADDSTAGTADCKAAMTVRYHRVEETIQTVDYEENPLHWDPGPRACVSCWD